MMNVLATPGEVFDEVKQAPASTSNWLVPALLLIVVGWLGAWVIFSQENLMHQLSEITDQAIQKQVAHLTPEAADAQRQVAETWARRMQLFGAIAGPPLVAFASPFFWGFLLWLLGNKALKGDFRYMKAVEIAGLSNVVSVLKSLVTTLLVVVLGDLLVSPSPLLFLKMDPKTTLYALLGAFNVMTLWLLGVRAIGLARLSGASTMKACLCIFGLWAVYTAVMVGLGAAWRALFGA